MPTRTVTCPHCSGLSKVDTAAGNANFRCPHCQAAMSLTSPKPPLRDSAKPSDLNCPACQGRFRIPADLKGSLVKCPHCQDPVRIDLSNTEMGSGSEEKPTTAAEPPSFVINTQADGDRVRGSSSDHSVDAPPDESFIISVGDRKVTLKNQSKTVEYRGAKLRVRELTRDERTNRRNTRNIVVGACALLTLIVAAMLLVRD